MCYNSGPILFVVPKNATSIGQSAFENSIIKTLTIPSQSGLKTIGKNAFKNSKLSVVNFNSTNLTTIGESAFEGSQLKGHLNLPEGLTTINKKAFVGTYISEVTIPSTVTTI
jgi:hypothetical protein